MQQLSELENTSLQVDCVDETVLTLLASSCNCILLAYACVTGEWLFVAASLRKVNQANTCAKEASGSSNRILLTPSLQESLSRACETFSSVFFCMQERSQKSRQQRTSAGSRGNFHFKLVFCLRIVKLELQNVNLTFVL